MMKLGKFSSEELETLILRQFRHTREEVVLRPKVGVDCGALDLGENLCVLSTDPITVSGGQMGKLCVHVCCNDAAACGAEPVALLVTLLIPPHASKSEVAAFAKEFGEACAELGVEVVGGHTEVTHAVTRMVVSATVIAKAPRGKIITAADMRAGDDLVMTKWAGLEGSAVLAADYGSRLADALTFQELWEAQQLTRHLSVVAEARVALQNGAVAMHDVTEGGIFGAVWEMASASGCGAVVFTSRIPLLPTTRKICAALKLDPYRLISSGCMLIACADGVGMVSALNGAGIEATLIGRAVAEKGCWEENGAVIEQEPMDEIYKI